jgi:hypothetical protein
MKETGKLTVKSYYLKKRKEPIKIILKERLNDLIKPFNLVRENPTTAGPILLLIKI